MRALVHPLRSLAAALAVAGALSSGPARAESGPELVKRAHDTFEYGDFPKTVSLLDGLADRGDLSESERIEAWKMLGLSWFYLHDEPHAAGAMFELLKQAPDYELDPFYVPPDAVAFFDEVKKSHEAYLAPIRERRKEAAQKARELAPGQTPAVQLLPPPSVLEHRLERSSLVVAWMPFGLGQFQNGSRRLGTALVASEAAAAVASIGSYLLIEALRSNKTGKFSEENYPLAQKADTVRLWSGAAFYLLWLAGAIEANLDFVPAHDLGTTRLAPAEPAKMEAAPAPTTQGVEPAAPPRTAPAGSKPEAPSLVPKPAAAPPIVPPAATRPPPPPAVPLVPAPAPASAAPKAAQDGAGR